MMVAFRGSSISLKRSPTVWSLPSYTNSRSLLVRYILPLAASSASSELAVTRTSTIVGSESSVATSCWAEAAEVPMMAKSMIMPIVAARRLNRESSGGLLCSSGIQVASMIS